MQCWNFIFTVSRSRTVHFLYLIVIHVTTILLGCCFWNQCNVINRWIGILWWHISVITYQITFWQVDIFKLPKIVFSYNFVDLSDVNMSTCQIMMSTCQICMLTCLWWHISAITCQIIMSTCQIFMLTCQLFMSTCQKNIITTFSLISCFHIVFMPVTAIYLSIKYLTSRHNDLTSRHNY